VAGFQAFYPPFPNRWNNAVWQKTNTRRRVAVRAGSPFFLIKDMKWVNLRVY
jgi:hypothetical protein